MTRTKLRTPQVRVLQVLMPRRKNDDPVDWPLVNRAQLGVRAGYTAISGTITRALGGISAGSSSGDPYPGLLELKLIETVTLDLEGVKEVNYRITTEGISAYQHHVATYGTKLPDVREREACINKRYEKGEQNASEQSQAQT